MVRTYMGVTIINVEKMGIALTGRDVNTINQRANGRRSMRMVGIRSDAFGQPPLPLLTRGGEPERDKGCPVIWPGKSIAMNL